jgi:homocysteine S-methyltransferase
MSVIFIDAAMGTRLVDRGFDLSSPLWSASVLESNPEAIAEIHREDIAAGATVITTNSFRTTPYALHGAGFNGVEAHNRARALTLLSIRIAWKCIKESGKDIRIAGSIAPLADCYTPKAYPGNISSRPWHDAQLDNLDHQATDILLAETMNSAREAKLLAELALKREKEVWVSFTLNGNGRILNGDDLTVAAMDLERMGVDAVGINCSTPEVTLRAIKALREAIDIPIIAYPNMGKADHKSGKITNCLTADAFAEWTIKAEAAGASILGACCGSNQEHLQAITTALAEEPAS